MNLQDTIEIFAGGPGSGCNPQVAKCGRKSTGKDKSKQSRARTTYKPVTKADIKLSALVGTKVAQTLGGRTTPDHEPFDVLVGRIGIEVKTFTKNTNDKITMHKASLARKMKEARKMKLKKTFTILMDTREGKSQLYYKEGLGSFRLVSMTPVNWNSLKRAIR